MGASLVRIMVACGCVLGQGVLCLLQQTQEVLQLLAESIANRAAQHNRKHSSFAQCPSCCANL